jgi:hypothetical protein
LLATLVLDESAELGQGRGVRSAFDEKATFLGEELVVTEDVLKETPPRWAPSLGNEGAPGAEVNKRHGGDVVLTLQTAPAVRPPSRRISRSLANFTDQERHAA